MATPFRFPDVGFVSEIRSFQKALSLLFPGIEIRRTRREGGFGPESGPDRPRILLWVGSVKIVPHSSYVAYAEIPVSVAYFATGWEDAQDAAGKLSSLGVTGRIPLYDYSGVHNPLTDQPVLTDYMVRIAETGSGSGRVRGVGVSIEQDADNDQAWRVHASLTLEGKRSVGPTTDPPVITSIGLRGAAA